MPRSLRKGACGPRFALRFNDLRGVAWLLHECCTVAQHEVEHKGRSARLFAPRETDGETYRLGRIQPHALVIALGCQLAQRGRNLHPSLGEVLARAVADVCLHLGEAQGPRCHDAQGMRVVAGVSGCDGELVLRHAELVDDVAAVRVSQRLLAGAEVGFLLNSTVRHRGVGLTGLFGARARRDMAIGWKSCQVDKWGACLDIAS
jgi:hypothetical protein